MALLSARDRAHGRHCACADCRERRAARRVPAPRRNLPPAPPRTTQETQILWNLAGEFSTLGQRIRANGGRW